MITETDKQHHVTTTEIVNVTICKCLIGEDVYEIFGTPIKFTKGNYKTKNVIHLVTCRLCKKPYTGQSMAGHVECYYKVLGKSS